MLACAFVVAAVCAPAPAVAAGVPIDRSSSRLFLAQGTPLTQLSYLTYGTAGAFFTSIGATVKTTVRGSLRIGKTVNKRHVRAGGTIGYAILVTNATSVDVERVRVCDRLPSGLVYASSSPKATRSDARWCWDLQTVASHWSKRVRITVRVLRGARGRRTNAATVSARGVSARADAAPSVSVLAAGVRGGGVTG